MGGIRISNVFFPRGNTNSDEWAWIFYIFTKALHGEIGLDFLITYHVGEF